MSAGHRLYPLDSDEECHRTLLELWGSHAEDPNSLQNQLFDPSGSVSLQNISNLAWPGRMLDTTHGQGGLDDSASMPPASTSSALAEQPINIGTDQYLHSTISPVAHHPGFPSIWATGTSYPTGPQVYGEDHGRIIAPASTWTGTTHAGGSLSAPDLGSHSVQPTPPPTKTLVDQIVHR